MSPFKDTGEMNRRVASGFAGGGVVGGAAAFAAITATADLAGQTGKMFREDATLAYKFGSFLGAVVLAYIYYKVFYDDVKLQGGVLGIAIVITVFTQSMYSIAKDLEKLRAVHPYLSQGYSWSWFYGFVATAFVVFYCVSTGSNTMEIGSFALDTNQFFTFMFVVFPKVSYWLIRQGKMNNYVRALNEGCTKKEVQSEVKGMKESLGLRIWKPSALNFISTPLLAAAWYFGQ